MKRNKRMAVWGLLAALCLCLSGCRMALEDQSAPPDRFVGFSVLLEGHVPANPEMDRSLPHEVDGQTLIVYTVEEGEDTYAMSDSGEWLGDVHVHFKSTDEGDEHYIRGTLYICNELLPGGLVLKAEQVYQRADGSMYAVNGGNNYSGHLDGLEIKVSESRRVTGPDGQAQGELCEATLTVTGCERVISAALVEMNGAGERLAAHPLAETEEIWFSEEADWALLEETLADGTIRRTAVNAPLDGETVEIRIPDEIGVCIPHGYTLRQGGMLTGDAHGA